MRKTLTFVLCALATTAGAQVRVQEYPIPSGHRVHDVWADAKPDGPIWISAQGSGHLGAARALGVSPTMMPAVATNLPRPTLTPTSPSP